MQLNTYLNYGGNCRQAFEFYEKHLGGRISMLSTHGDVPDPSGVPAEWRNAVLHARIELGGTTLFGADVPPDRFQPMLSEATRGYYAERRGGAHLCPAVRRWAGVHGDGGDVLRPSLRDAPGPVRYVVDAAPRALAAIRTTVRPNGR